MSTDIANRRLLRNRETQCAAVQNREEQFTGLADFNDVLNTGLNPGISVAATYLADEANPGRITALVTLADAVPNNVTLYQASSSLLLHVDVDSTGNGLGTVGLGVLEQQQLSQ